MAVSGPLIRVLTGADIVFAPEAGTSVPGTVPRALFVALFLDAGREVSRDRLVGLLWPDTDQSTARQRLRMTLLNLRRSLADPLARRIVATPDGLRLDMDPEESDLGRFRQELAGGDPGCAERAADLYDGPLLGGFPSVSDPFDKGLSDHRTRFSEQALSAVLTAMEHRASTGDRAGFVLLHRKGLTIDPADGDLCMQAMRFHAERGRPDRVRAVFDQFADALQETFAIGPTDAQARLRDDLVSRAGRVSPAEPEPKPPPPPTLVHPNFAAGALPVPRRMRRWQGLAGLAVLLAAIFSVWWLRTVVPDTSRIELILREAPYSPVACRETGLDDSLRAALFDSLRQTDGVGIVLVPDQTVIARGGTRGVILQVDLVCNGDVARAVLTLLDARDSSVLWSMSYDPLVSGVDRIPEDLPAAIQGLR